MLAMAALPPGETEHLSAQEVGYGGGSGGGRIERRDYLGKQKVAKYLVLFIPNLSSCCLRHFLNVFFSYVLAISGGWRHHHARGRTVLSVTEMCTTEQINSSDRDFLSHSWMVCTLHVQRQ